jgi:hypothetical protein
MEFLIPDLLNPHNLYFLPRKCAFRGFFGKAGFLIYDISVQRVKENVIILTRNQHTLII